MSVAQTTQAKIAAALGDVNDWQVFGVYDYARRCQQCACGHSIAQVFVLIRKGDHGPLFGETVRLGSECIKYVKTLNPELYTWLLTAKAEQVKIQRAMFRARVEALRETPEFKAAYRELEAFRHLAYFAGRGGGVPGPVFLLCQNNGIVINATATAFFSLKTLAVYIGKHEYDLIEDVNRDVAAARKILAEVRTLLAPAKDFLVAMFKGKSDHLPGASDVRLLFPE